MNKPLSRLSLACFIGLLSACGGGGGGSSTSGSGSTGGGAATAEWTYMVYMAGDNNLSAAAIDDINEMEAVGSSDKVNVVVQAEFSPTYTPQVPGVRSKDGVVIGVPGGGGVPVGAVINPTVRGKIIKDADPAWISSRLSSAGGNLDMGKAQTLTDFIAWSKANYPAKHYALVLWSHGDGWKIRRDLGGAVNKGALADDTSGSFMALPDIAQAVKNSGIRLDVLNFDACLMGMYEVAHAFTEVADYLVASEEVEPSQGDNYKDTLQQLRNTPGMSGLSLAETISREYRSYYVADPAFRDDAVTKSVIRLSAVPALQNALEALGQYGADHLSTHRVAIQAARLASVSYANKHSHDLVDFLNQLETQPSAAADPSFLTLIRAARAAALAAVDENQVYSTAAVAPVTRSRGLAIFLPNKAQVTQDELTQYDGLSSNQGGKTAWRNFVNQLVSGEAGGLLEKVEGNFAFTIRWDDPNTDIDLYISEPDDIYAPYMGVRTPNGFFTPDSSESGQPMEGYVADEHVQKGGYDVFVNYYDGFDPTTVDLYYADATTPEAKVDSLRLPVAGKPNAPLTSDPLTDPGIAAGSYADWWYPGGTTRSRSAPGSLTRTWVMPSGQTVNVHFAERRAKLKRSLRRGKGGR